VMRFRTFAGIITLFFGIVASASRAAAADAAIRGSVVDASGGVLPGVTVTATSATPQAEPQTQVTDGDGKFSFDDLPPGPYTPVVALDGFAEKKFDAIAVPATEELKAILGLATLSETITVRATLPPTESMPREST